MSLVVYKSSAGSGKTSTLVTEYLALALIKPKQFRQIIALTFTKKATLEMKNRLVEYLIYLQEMDIQNINDKYKHIVEKIEEITSFSKQNIKDNSKILLQKILHNYGDFGFSTIDSFVVKIVRSFSHDLQLASNFEIELDTDLIISQALEKFYQLIGKNKNITKFLVDYVLNQLEDEKSTDLDILMSKFAAITFDSKHYSNVDLLKGVDLENFSKIKSILQKEQKLYDNTVSEFGKKGIDCLNKFGLKPKDCSSSWLSNYFEKLKNKHKYIYDISTLENKSFIKYIEHDEKWYTKSQKNDVIERIDNAKSEILKIIGEARNYYSNQLPHYLTNKLILNKITPLALIHIFKELINDFCKENEVVHLSEVNRKIAEVIQDQHTPYIYERIGHKYSNYLIDEFQDTSVIQWNNILPLIDNSLANGQHCLLVGDAKQSIYRWRDGEVEQFVNLPKLKGAEDSKLIAEQQNLIVNSIDIKNLDTNYRSLKNIIDFNNTFFSHLLESEDDYVKNIFSDFVQKTPKESNDGFIKLKNFQDDKDDEELLNEILLQIEDLTKNQNYKPNEICILARSNKLLMLIADFLVKNGLTVMSADALRLYKSKSINFIISILNIVEGINIPINSYTASRYLLENNLIDKIQTFQSASDFFDFLNSQNIEIQYSEIRQFTAIEIVEKIISTFITNANISPFVYRLLDLMLEQNNKIGSSVSAFLKYWNENITKISINVPESNDAVRLLTIHSAKGLEFPVVIFPAISLDDNLDGRDYLWINTPKAIEGLSPILLTANDKIGLKSSEKRLFEKDQSRKNLDRLNLLYVACTRPAEQLFIYFNKKTRGEDIWESKISKLPIINQEIEFRQKNEISIGSAPVHEIKSKKSVSEINKLKDYYYNDWREKISIKTDYRETSVEIKKQKGIQLHYLLSQLDNKIIIEDLISKAIAEQKISEEYKSEFIEILTEIINNNTTNIFFNSEDEVISEKEILTKENKTLRPDKLITKNNEIWVVDFKYADRSQIRESEISHHEKQVREYMDVISQIESKKTLGFLMYLDGLPRIFDINQQLFV